jgi:hypothetical protein
LLLAEDLPLAATQRLRPAELKKKVEAKLVEGGVA